MTAIPAKTMARLAALDHCCDFRMDRRERSDRENAGRVGRFWRVEIAARGDLSEPGIARGPLAKTVVAQNRIVAEDVVLAVALWTAIEEAERRGWGRE